MNIRVVSGGDQFYVTMSKGAVRYMDPRGVYTDIWYVMDKKSSFNGTEGVKLGIDYDDSKVRGSNSNGRVVK